MTDEGPLGAQLRSHAAAIGARVALSHRKTQLTFGALLATCARLREMVAPLEGGPRLVYLECPDMNWCATVAGYAALVMADHVPVLTNSARGSLGNLPSLVIGADGNRIDGILEASGGSVADGRVSAGRPLDVVFSSGTSGARKAFLFGQRQFMGRAPAASPVAPVGAVHVGIPFNTSTGSHAIALRHLVKGISSHCLSPRAKWPALAEHLRATRSMELSTTPYQLELLLASFDAPVEVPRIVRVYAGPLPDGLRKLASRAFPRARIVSIYGATEAANAILTRDSAGQIFSDRRGEGRFGIWMPEAGRWAQTGETGRILVCMDPGGFPVQLPESDTDADPDLPEGWTDTGDFGRRCADGSIELGGRTQDIIFAGTQRLSALEIEGRLFDLPPRGQLTLFNATADGEQRLCGAYEPAIESADFDVSAPRWQALRELVSAVDLVVVPQLPRTLLGKVSRSTCAGFAGRYLTDTPAIALRGTGKQGSLRVFLAPGFSRSARIADGTVRA
jgi:acyl-coenzyme A synthetase/AMP-(fatty) acid ligase